MEKSEKTLCGALCGSPIVNRHVVHLEHVLLKEPYRLGDRLSSAPRTSTCV
ncbi:hypothetical protein [Sorangium sp. So ce426]|uniref:hypothetical protein n=1 Tax=Sorangium sp. So ce426 TaxID=3133312 RepID=UPI003F5BBDAD